jgi:hypothetical protein
VFQRVIMPLAALAVLTAMAGCTGTTPTVVPKGRLEVTATIGAERQKIAVTMLQELVIKLPPVTHPGDQWTLVFNDGRFLQLRAPVQHAADGSASASFVAIRQGRRLLRFLELAPKDKEAIPNGGWDAMVTIE